MATNAHGKHEHAVPLWGLFLALLALTAGEVGLYEIWRVTHFVPKYVIVLIILVLTLPKALIVLVYFMHVKFEKQLIVLLAVVPFFMAGIAVLPTLTDSLVLKGHMDNKVQSIGHYQNEHDGHGDDAATPAPVPAGDSGDPFGY